MRVKSLEFLDLNHDREQVLFGAFRVPLATREERRLAGLEPVTPIIRTDRPPDP